MYRQQYILRSSCITKQIRFMRAYISIRMETASAVILKHDLCLAINQRDNGHRCVDIIRHNKNSASKAKVIVDVPVPSSLVSRR